MTFVFDKFEDLKNALVQAEKDFNREKVEIAFHESRINTYESKIQSHKARIVQIESGEGPEEDIEMEEV